MTTEWVAKRLRDAGYKVKVEFQDRIHPGRAAKYYDQEQTGPIQVD